MSENPVGLWERPAMVAAMGPSGKSRIDRLPAGKSYHYAEKV